MTEPPERPQSVPSLVAARARPEDASVVTAAMWSGSVAWRSPSTTATATARRTSADPPCDKPAILSSSPNIRRSVRPRGVSPRHASGVIDLGVLTGCGRVRAHPAAGANAAISAASSEDIDAPTAMVAQRVTQAPEPPETMSDAALPEMRRVVRRDRGTANRRELHPVCLDADSRGHAARLRRPSGPLMCRRSASTSLAAPAGCGAAGTTLLGSRKRTGRPGRPGCA